MKTGDAVRMPEAKCTNCKHDMDAASCVGVEGEVKPSPGDVTICIYCGHLMAFASDCTLRELTSSEMNDVAGDPRILAIQKARDHVFRERKLQ